VAIGEERKGQAGVTVAELTDAISAATPVLDAEDQRIVMGTYRLLAKGEPVTADAIARASDLPVGRVEEALSSWPGVYRDDGGRVVGFWGLALAPIDAEYRLVVEGRTSYAWCALDTLFIPAYLGKTVHVEATDPVTGAPVSLVVDGSGVRELSPSDAVVSVVIPDGPFGYDVIESFCSRVFFFASEETGRSWVADHAGTTLLSVLDAFELGEAVFVRSAPDVFGARN
jgi:alkylmercury lyase